MKVLLINFWRFTRHRYFPKCTLTVIKSIAKICCTASYILFRTRATMKFVTSKICVAIYNSITNIVLTPISVFKLACLVNILTNRTMFTVTSRTFRLLGVSTSNFWPYQIFLKVWALRQSIMGGFSPNSFMFLVRRVHSTSFKHIHRHNFWENLWCVAQFGTICAI